VAPPPRHGRETGEAALSRAFYRFAQGAKNARFVPVKLTLRDALIRRNFLTAI
jgi:hypothetical protein